MTTTRRGLTASRIDELPAGLGGAARLVRAGLGIRAFGVQILELPPESTAPEHDETATGQEELYVALRGSGAVIADGDGVPLDAEHVVLAAPEVRRALSAGSDGLRVLCVGGVPGAAYTPPEWTETAQEAAR